MPADPSLVLFACAWLLAGFVNGVSGMGAAMCALPIVAGSMAPQLLIPATCLMVFVVSLATAAPYMAYTRWKSLPALLAGAAPGAAAGLAVLLVTPAWALQLGAGAIMLLFTLWQFFTPSLRPHGDSWPAGLVGGFGSGFVNTSISFGNPPIAIYALYAGWDKLETMGTMNVCTTITALFTCAAHGMAGLYNAQVMEYALWGAPATVAGLVLSLPVAKRINQQTFRKILLVVIGIAGAICVARGLKAILGW